MFIRKVSLKPIIGIIGIQKSLLDKRKRDFKNILFLYQKRINCWGKRIKNNEDNIMDSNKKLQNCCKMFRDIEMKIWNDRDCVKMNIPLSGGFMLTINTKFVQKSKKSRICISDDGCIVKYNKVTLEDINTLCKRYHLECTIDWNEEYTSLNCEIYKIVNEKNFCKIIWKIMYLAEDIQRITRRR